VLFGDQPFAGLDDATLAEAFEEAPSAGAQPQPARGRHRAARADDRGRATKGNSEARRLVQQGGVRLNNTVVDDPKRIVGPDDLASERTLVIKVGKKRYFLARFHP
jgi:tyrosyl-tRNA synthetase